MTIPLIDPLPRLHQLQTMDLPVHGGRTLAYVFDSGMPDVDEIGTAAVAAYAGSNGLDPTAFPSLLQMENELVGMAAELVDAPESAVGTVTSGGTESVLLAVVTARDSRPDIKHPNMVIPSTAHACFHKAAHYFGVEKKVIQVGPDFRADPAAMAAAIDENTVLVVGSAPSYAHGVIDPIPQIAAIAKAAGVRCHVDACIGGWVLAFAPRLGRQVTPWTFAVDGVTSISLDTHKYGYAPKGTSVLMHRTSELRLPQFTANASWPGYTVINSTIQSTKSGGPLAGAWAVSQAIGIDGYTKLSGEVFAGVDAMVAAIDAHPHLHLITHPDSSLVVVGTDDLLDPFSLCDAMMQRGWFIQAQPSYAGLPATIHMTISAGTLQHIDEFLAALDDAVDECIAAGPIKIDPGLAAMVASIDADSLTGEQFAGLLAAANLMGPGGGMPERMGPVNALLDIAAPPVREKILILFMDLLTHPVRPV